MRKGNVVLEMIVAVFIVSLSVGVLAGAVSSGHALSSYSIDRIITSNLAVIKMQEIEGKIQSEHFKIYTDKYYGFQYDPGTSDDLKRDPQTYNKDPGTFYQFGHPEIRYQYWFTISDAINGNPKLIGVHLRVWRYSGSVDTMIQYRYFFEVRYD